MLVLALRTSRTEEFVDITDDVERLLSRASSAREGAVLLFCPHTTAGLFVNEGADPDVASDLLSILSRLVPRNGQYRHLEGNAAAHIRSVLTGSSLYIPISNGRLALGTWQRIFFAEFDGPRQRKVFVQFLQAASCDT